MSLRSACFVLLAAAVAALITEGCGPVRPRESDVDAYLAARDLYLRGSVDEAAAALSRIDSRTRGFHQARLLEGKILFFRAKMPEAEQVFRDLAGSQPGYIEAQLWLLRTLQAERKAAEAERLLDRALELNPSDPRLLHLAGMLKLEADDINGALSFFRRAQDYGTELAQSYVESARILYRFGLVDAALADLGTAQALLPATSDMRTPVEDLMRRLREAGR